MGDYEYIVSLMSYQTLYQKSKASTDDKTIKFFVFNTNSFTLLVNKRIEVLLPKRCTAWVVYLTYELHIKNQSLIPKKNTRILSLESKLQPPHTKRQTIFFKLKGLSTIKKLLLVEYSMCHSKWLTRLLSWTLQCYGIEIDR